MTLHLIALLFAAAIGGTVGWILACIALGNDASDLADALEAERQALDEEREMLTRYWTLDVQPPNRDLEWDLGAHKRPRVVS